MKKILFLLFALAFSSASFAQADFSMTVLAGSNAPWGETQYLHIDAKGKCFYRLSDARAGSKDSSSFTITKNELKQISDVITKAHFYSLKEVYDADMSDGSRLSIAITSGKKTHSVQLINEQLPEMTTLLDKLNSVAAAYKIHINY